MVKSDKCMGISQLIADTCPGCSSNKSTPMSIIIFATKASTRTIAYSFIHSFIHSFIRSYIQIFIHLFRLYLWRLFKSTSTLRRSRHSLGAVSEFHAEAPQATASKELAQDPYMYMYEVARVGFKSATFGRKAPSLPMSHHAPLPIYLKPKQHLN